MENIFRRERVYGAIKNAQFEFEPRVRVLNEKYNSL